MRCLICGMNINVNNFDMNNKSLLEENEIEHMKYCPFCGVTSKYLKSKDEAEVYKVDSQCLDKNTLGILERAMKLEIFNSEFYSAAAQLAQEAGVKETFEDLSKIEKIHAIVHQRLGGFKELPKLAVIDYSKHKNDISLMQLAEDREIHAVKFYEKYSKEINNLVVKEVLVALSEVERGHIQIASKLLTHIL